MIHVAYAMNKKYEKYFILSLHSLLRTTKSKICVHVYAEDSKGVEATLNQFTQIYHHLSYDVINLDPIKDKMISEWISSFPAYTMGFAHIRKEAFVRLLLPELLPKITKLIYSDCDIIYVSDIKEVEKLPQNGFAILASIGYETSKRQAKELGRMYHFGSGFLVMDLKKLREIKMKEIIDKNWEWALNKARIPSADETLLNVLFYECIDKLPDEFNYCYDRNYGERTVAPENVKSWHVCGGDKSAMVKLFINYSHPELKK